MNKVDIDIKFTEDEKSLLVIIKNTISHFAPHTTARICGGFVRDKLLGKQSHDIDIMIDNMSGEKFAQLITRTMGLKDPHVVKANPDASKHMETAGASIPLPNGAVLDVDFAMARSEVYHDNSRIPDIKPATPAEDAERRDLTINSLFYNINNGKVEDFTGNGIKDLIANVIRTPLEPNKTFMDDPLRVFRTIRFASKYNGQIDPDTYEAMKNPLIKEEIRKKISKERIQEEISKTFSNPSEKPPAVSASERL